MSLNELLAAGVLAALLRGISVGVGVFYLGRAAWMWRWYMVVRRRDRMRMLSMGLFMLTGTAAGVGAIATAAPATFLTPLLTVAMITGLVAACETRRPPTLERKDPP